MDTPYKPPGGKVQPSSRPLVKSSKLPPKPNPAIVQADEYAVSDFEVSEDDSKLSDNEPAPTKPAPKPTGKKMNEVEWDWPLNNDDIE